MRRIFPFLCAVLAIGLYACAPSTPPDVTAAPTDDIITPFPSPLATQTLSISPVLIDVTLYLPEDSGEGLVAVAAQSEDSPQGLITALVAAGALPEVNYGRNITLSVENETLTYDGTEKSGVFVHLDLSDAFAQSIKQSGAAKERLILQSLANTFLTRYGADGFLLSIEGTDLETTTQRYNRPLSFDELAPTLSTDPATTK